MAPALHLLVILSCAQISILPHDHRTTGVPPIRCKPMSGRFKLFLSVLMRLRPPLCSQEGGLTSASVSISIMVDIAGFRFTTFILPLAELWFDDG